MERSRVFRLLNGLGFQTRARQVASNLNSSYCSTRTSFLEIGPLDTRYWGSLLRGLASQHIVQAESSELAVPIHVDSRLSGHSVESNARKAPFSSEEGRANARTRGRRQRLIRVAPASSGVDKRADVINLPEGLAKLPEGPPELEPKLVSESLGSSRSLDKLAPGIVPGVEGVRDWLSNRAIPTEGSASEGSRVPIEAQRLLHVGVIGAPNAGKSVLTNKLVGSKISAESHKTNTTRRETLGALTEGETQLLFHDTPGLVYEVRAQELRADSRQLVHRAWKAAHKCDVLLVLVDAHRQLTKPDTRVYELVTRLSEKLAPDQKAALLLNKVDIVVNKRKLVKLAEQFLALHTFDRYFFTSGKKGAGLGDLKRYLVEKAPLRAWELPPDEQTDQAPEMRALEVVRGHVFSRLHDELPYHLGLKHISWEEFKDGSVRIEQNLEVDTLHQRKIAVGLGGTCIRQIGQGARLELEDIFKRKVHLIIKVVIRNTHGSSSKQHQDFSLRAIPKPIVKRPLGQDKSAADFVEVCSKAAAKAHGSPHAKQKEPTQPTSERQTAPTLAPSFKARKALKVPGAAPRPPAAIPSPQLVEETSLTNQPSQEALTLSFGSREPQPANGAKAGTTEKSKKVSTSARKNSTEIEQGDAEASKRKPSGTDGDAAPAKKRKPANKEAQPAEGVDKTSDTSEKAPRKRATAADVDSGANEQKVRANYSEGKLKDLTLPELKNFLAIRKEKVGGKKDVLIERVAQLLSKADSRVTT